MINMGDLPTGLEWGDFTTPQARRYKRVLGGWFECSMCADRTRDPLGHGYDTPCFAPYPVCEVRVCQQPISGPAEIVFGKVGQAGRVAHAHCYLNAYPCGMVWLW